MNDMKWIGFQKTSSIIVYCKGYIGLLFLLTFQAIVTNRQKVIRHQNKLLEPKAGILFPEISRKEADEGIIECIKYLFNYFFYKTGVEFCFIIMVCCIGIRPDIFSIISALWLYLLFLLHRETLAKIWPFYIAYLCFLLPLQYMLCLGIPPSFCFEYLWTDLIDSGTREWLYLPDNKEPPEVSKILVEFFQLLFACCQFYVFSIEMSPNAESYKGGSNKEISNLLFEEKQENLVSDFITFTKSYLDMIKIAVFFSSYWITLALLFFAGTVRINLFAMGYVFGCFFFLWNGQELYLQPLKQLLQMWNYLLSYNVFVILFKAILQMKELRNFGKIDDGALMHYVIKGINDKHENKAILYGCKDLLEFKEKLKVYEVIKSDSVKSKGVFDRVKPKHDSYNRNNNTFDRNKPSYGNYGSNTKCENGNKNNINVGNTLNIYPYEYKFGLMAKCEAFGHKASECPRSNSKPEVATLDVTIKPKLFKTIIIGNIGIKAVIDTGSQATLLRKSVFDKLSFRRLSPINSTLNGFGKSVVDPLGCFTEIFK
ncbi:piezo-type mechanosensitive ion channel component 2-like [Centruroides sculpturatus]|uniref:piezo-type mechanosensitive ion channel component 2-like n=1 Tax=Centruroides sculpturatus TaxID=218467 RepID=UPI000C6CD6FA|nr:piezo-type mechanosensitive ion channel component 2-like [Centruroides sculpturatus]